MKIKVFYPDKDGKISFTKDALQKLLDSVYQEGHSDGYNQGYNVRPYWYWSSPYYYATNNPSSITTTLNGTSITADNLENNTITIPKPASYKIEFN